ncbi:MAG TPA: SGNH/GDSL hydrolase family protein [Chthoniobacteraceae bacterium]|nr:SGNH/GDSL hydrolase family protein [Chthoniobacteraceae bacterium]
MKGLPVLPLLLLVAGALSPLPAQQPAAALPRDFLPAPGRVAPMDGDTFVFLGDSITHQCLYTQYIEDFYYTRFPKLRLHFHNAGTGGDKVADALERFDEDAAAFKPRFVSVLLGMNDGGFTDFQQPLFDKYQQDMATLLGAIGKIGATPIILSPTMYDPLPNKLNNRTLEPRDSAYPKVLETYTAWLKEQAKQRSLPFADFYFPFRSVMEDQRRNESDWTIIPDAMHPAAPGHVIMAAAFINDAAFHPPVSDIAIVRKDGKLTGTGATGVLADLAEAGDDKVTFTFTSASLPWVVPPEGAEGMKLLKPTVKLNQERVIVRGIKPGTYELKIDGEAIGRWTDKEFNTGVDLAGLATTPQYRQALKVALLNLKRNALGEHPMRVQWAYLKGQRAMLKAEEEKPNATPAQIESRRKQFETFREGMRKSVAEFVKDSQTVEDEIYEANQPVARKYEVTPVAES